MLKLRFTANLLKLVLLFCTLISLAKQISRSDIINELLQDNPLTCRQSHANETQSDCKNGFRSRSPLVSSNLRTVENEGWFMDYFEEQSDGFELHIMEDSFDERLANIIYAVNTHKTSETDSHSYNSGDSDLDLKNMEAVASPEVSEVECYEHLNEMVSLMEDTNQRLSNKRRGLTKELGFDERHFRLARVLDSFGRYESGFMSGRTQTVGQFDQCVSSRLLLGGTESVSDDTSRPDSATQMVGTRFCWVGLGASKHLNSALRVGSPVGSRPAQYRILVGACLPRTCHSRTLVKNKNEASRGLVQKLVDSQFQLPKSIYLDENLEVTSIFCLVDRDSPHASLPLSGKLILLFLAAWFMLTIYASVFTASNRRVALNDEATLFSSVMDCLDIRQSIDDFLGRKERPLSTAELEKREVLWRDRRVDLSALDPVKVFGCCFVVLGHTLVLGTAFNQNPLKTFHVALKDPMILLMIIGTSVVDLFIVITGILMGYLTMKRANGVPTSQGTEIPPPKRPTTPASEEVASRSLATKANRSQVELFFRHWVKFTLNRHLLLVPLLFLVFWFKKSVFINSFGDKPLWDVGFNRVTIAGSCKQESWLSPLTMSAAFMPLNAQCLPQSWSVSTDLFFSLVLPPVILLMPKRPKLALIIGVITTLVSNALSTVAYQALEPTKKRALDELRFEGFVMMFGSIHHLYTYPHYRLSTVLIGLLAGYHLYEYGNGKSEWPVWFRKTATRGALIGILQISLLFISLPYWKPIVHPYEYLLFALLFTFFRVVLASGFAIILLRMATDWRHTSVMQLCTGQLWRSMVKLNYAILLVHLDVLLYQAMANLEVNYFSKHVLMTNFAAAYLYCILLAMFLHIVYENPFNKLVRRHLIPLIG